MAICERCYKETIGIMMSMFNTQMLCMDCKDKEEKHDHYKKAVETDENAIRNGNTNFRGIGKPRDL